MDEMPEGEKAPPDRPVARSLLRTEILITSTTLVISIALAYFSFVQADASRKMQRTETWPYVSYITENSSPEVKNEISFSLSNDGVGPARLQEMEFIYNGKRMRDPMEFLAACCAAAARAEKSLTFSTDRVDGVLRPGQERNFFRLAKNDDNAALWDQLNVERWKVVVRTCYCSIFDDCWVFDSRKEQPDEVKVCPANWTQFGEHPEVRPNAEEPAEPKESLAP
jgi:hypothetical protein